MIILDQEQKLIEQSVSRFIADQFDFSHRQKIAESTDGFDRNHWKQFADLGLLGISIAEQYGGFGGSVVDLAIICQQQARALMMSPYLSTFGASATVLAMAGNERQKLDYLGAVARGEAIISCAFNETDNPEGIPQTSAAAVAEGFLLNGCKRLVPYGAQADYLIVSSINSERQILLIVPASSEGIRLRPYKMYDGSRSADIEFSDVIVAADQVLNQASGNEIQKVNSVTTALMCAEAVAIMWQVHDQTLEYMKTREQFGQTLGSMQALQHRIVDVYVGCQLAQSMAEQAVLSAAEIDAMNPAAYQEKLRQISAAKAYIGEQGRQVGKEGIQLHGGIGMTNDIPIGHYLKRLTAIDRLNGDSTWHRNRFRSLDNLDFA